MCLLNGSKCCVVNSQFDNIHDNFTSVSNNGLDYDINKQEPQPQQQQMKMKE